MHWKNAYIKSSKMNDELLARDLEVDCDPDKHKTELDWLLSSSHVQSACETKFRNGLINSMTNGPEDVVAMPCWHKFKCETKSMSTQN